MWYVYVQDVKTDNVMLSMPLGGGKKATAKLIDLGLHTVRTCTAYLPSYLRNCGRRDALARCAPGTNVSLCCLQLNCILDAVGSRVRGDVDKDASSYLKFDSKITNACTMYVMHNRLALRPAITDDLMVWGVL